MLEDGFIGGADALAAAVKEQEEMNSSMQFGTAMAEMYAEANRSVVVAVEEVAEELEFGTAMADEYAQKAILAGEASNRASLQFAASKRTS